MRISPLAIAAFGVACAAHATAPVGNVISYPAEFFAQLRPDTALDMVQRLPGFVFDDGNAVRGFGGAAGNVLIDGQRPTSKSDDLASILRRLPASQVARIDVIRGATPGIDMQGKTVVANILLRQASGFSGAAVLGQYNVVQGYLDPDARLEAAWRRNGRSLEGSLYAFQGHDNSEGSGPHEVRGANGELLDRSRTRNSQPNWEYKATAAGETPLAGGRFRANVTLDAQPFRRTSIDDFLTAGRQEERVHQTQESGELGLHFSRGIASNLGLEVIGLQQLSHTNFRSDFQTVGQDQHFRVTDRQSESVGRIVLHWQHSARLTADGGGEFAYNSLRAGTSFSVDGTPVAIPAANVRVTERRGEAFGTMTWRPRDNLSVEGGLRAEFSTISSVGDLSRSRNLAFAKPRLVLTWAPDADDQIRVRVEREVGQLSFTQFVASGSLNATGVIAGNPNLFPQQDWVFEAAYERHFWRDAAVSLTARRLVLADVIDHVPVFTSSGVFDAPGNIGHGSETDLIANVNVPLARAGLSGFTLRGTATWRRSLVSDPTTGENRRISGQHPVDAELHLTQEIPGLRINWGVEIYFSASERFFRFNEIDTNRIGGFADLYVDYKPRPDLVVRVQLYTSNTYAAERALFTGPRNAAGLNMIDLQRRTFGPLLFMRVRKTF
jgi:hypothetical protein